MMSDIGTAAPGFGGRRIVAALAVAAAAAIALAGCSSSSGDALTLGKAFEKKEPKAGPKKAGKTSEGAGAAVNREAGKKPYPNLATVPNRPKVTSQERRLVIEEGLLADRSRAKHTDATPVWARPKTADVVTGDQAGEGPKVQTVTVAGARLATIRFPVGSARLPPGAAGLMRQIAAIQRRSGAKVIAVGHTSRRKRSADADKDKTAKDALSLARATAVTSLLARLGVRKENLEALGRGDTEPSNPRRPFLNRRVDIFMRR
jgi:flagellar motor protein MotB